MMRVEATTDTYCIASVLWCRVQGGAAGGAAVTRAAGPSGAVARAVCKAAGAVSRAAGAVSRAAGPVSRAAGAVSGAAGAVSGAAGAVSGAAGAGGEALVF